MPPRKSDVAKVADDEAVSTPNAKSTAANAPVSATPDANGVGIEDLGLPRSVVTRLAKSNLPANTQIQGNAMLALSKSATLFVSYLSTHANEYAQASNRKTINPTDVFDALADIEFPDFKPRLEAELAKYLEHQAEKKKKNKSKESDASAADHEDESETQGTEEPEKAVDGQPMTKKARRGKDASLNVAGAVGEETEEEAEEEADSDDSIVEEEEEEEEEVQEEGSSDEENNDVEENEAEQDEALDNGEDSD